jgi:hypothetical protein
LINKILINFLIIFLFVPVVNGGIKETPVSEQVKTINLFFKVLSKNSDSRISDLRQIYGKHGMEYEYGVLFGLFPEVKKETDTSKLRSEIRDFVTKNTPSLEGNSRWLKCIKFLDLQKFEDNAEIEIKLPPKFYGPYDDREFLIIRKKENWVFQFDSDSKYINQIKFPNGKNNWWIFKRCSNFKGINLNVNDIPK